MFHQKTCSCGSGGGSFGLSQGSFDRCPMYRDADGAGSGFGEPGQEVPTSTLDKGSGHMSLLGRDERTGL